MDLFSILQWFVAFVSIVFTAWTIYYSKRRVSEALNDYSPALRVESYGNRFDFGSPVLDDGGYDRFLVNDADIDTDAGDVPVPYAAYGDDASSKDFDLKSVDFSDDDVSRVIDGNRGIVYGKKTEEVYD